MRITAALDGTSGAGDEPFRTDTVDMGTPAVDLDRAQRLAAELEDDELVRRTRAGT